MRTHRHRLVLLSIPVALTALLATACSSDSGAAQSANAEPGASSSSSAASAASVPLVGSSWTLTTFADADGVETDGTPAPSAGTLEFLAKDKVAGSTGCNSFNGTFTQNGASLTVTVGPMTMKACSGAVAAQETAVLANLAAVTSFDTSSGLQLMADGSTVLTYVADGASLVGSSWTASGINNGKGGLETNAYTGKVTATFNDKGGISGNGGCNTYGADFTTSGKRGLTIGPVVSTMMACDPAELMATERQYFAALEKVARYERTGNQLTLKDAKGATQVTFIPASSQGDFD